MSDVANEVREIADDGGFSPVVETIFDTLLAAIHNGTLLPGARINDANLAQQFRVSRTPVREALQRLRDLGIVEAVAGKYTRVAIVTPNETAQAMVVWVALYSALVAEVVSEAPEPVHAAMARDHANFLEHLPERDFTAIATASFSFFTHLMALSQNPTLVQGITRVVHLIRLGSLHLPESIDVSALAQAQSELLRAVADRDSERAEGIVKKIRDIDVPVE